MAEQTFRSPDVYDREIDLSASPSTGPTGTPAGVVGTARKGPAFVPVTVKDFNDFKNVFGGTDFNRPGVYAAKQWLQNRSSLTFLRVIGTGVNQTTSQIAGTLSTGRVQSAGFKIIGTPAVDDTYGRHVGAVQFIAATHTIQTEEAAAMPIFTENSSRSASSKMNLLRGAVFMTSTARLMILDGDETTAGKFVANGPDDVGAVVAGKVKLVISSSLGATFATTDKIPGILVMTASLDPSSPDYFGKVLNTNPDKFVLKQHYLHLDLAVDDELATATSVAVLSGSINTSSSSGEKTTKFLNAFGAFDTRFKTPQTPWIISQPFGTTEYDLFKFEAIDDGEYANKLYKVSITNLKMSEDQSNPFGSFTVNIRDWNDNDLNPAIIEQYHNCSLDPTSANYIAQMIGDHKTFFNFDSIDDSERRLVVTGRYPNKSSYVRVIMNDSVEKGMIPARTLPFGFRGPEVLKTNDSLTDSPGTNPRLSGKLGVGSDSVLSGSIVPPIPMRFKLTRGEGLSVAEQTYVGQSSNSEIVNPSFHWGVKFERNTLVHNPNIIGEKNTLIDSFTKFEGIKLLDVLVTGSGADALNNNKFTLSRVALPNSSVTDLTASTDTHMRDAAYLRNAKIDSSTGNATDPVSSGARVTFGTLVNETTPFDFNRFQQYTKFTTFFMGGFEGLNFLDHSNRLMNDRSVSFDTGGEALSSYIPSGFATNQNGVETLNSNVYAYKTAVDVMTDVSNVIHNVLAIPGITESYITDYAMKKTKEYGLALYVLDIPGYTETSTRLYDDQATRPDVDKTAQILAGRAIDNNFVATYWPAVYVDDSDTKRRVKVPASVAVLGALGFNDRVAYPWYAPAGFNRASLDFVTNVEVRLGTTDRNILQDNRINPIATFPKEGFVIYGQKTLQIARSALDRVNVRRMLNEVKRVVIDKANSICFEQNTPELRQKFVSEVTTALALIQITSGMEKFRVVMNETNNTQADVEANRANGKVIVVPTRTAEFIAIDYIISRSGVTFV